jgi:hypothetical protein
MRIAVLPLMILAAASDAGRKAARPDRQPAQSQCAGIPRRG